MTLDRTRSQSLLLRTALCMSMTGLAQAQISFSISLNSDSAQGSTGANDILHPALPSGANPMDSTLWGPYLHLDPIPSPGIVTTGPAIILDTDIDAFSSGNDVVPSGNTGTGHFWFSVDGNTPSGLEAGGDLRVHLDPLALPSTGSVAASWTKIADASGRYEDDVPGLGLLDGDPNPQEPQLFDDLDGLDLEPLDASSILYYSVDPTSAASIIGIAGSAADIVVNTGGVDSVYASAALLGLDASGINQDDIDALIIEENGIPGYQSPLLAGDPDRILFSVTPESDVCEMLVIDSLQGLPIEPGDILAAPTATPPGGSTTPRIIVRAEVLGLRTARTHGVADNLDALDFSFDLNTDDQTDLNPRVYCQGKLNSAGCVPSIDHTGVASIALANSSSPNMLTVTASDVVNNKAGLLFVGTSGASAIPFQGGVLCVQPQLARTPLVYSFGNPTGNDCSGSFSVDLDVILDRLTTAGVSLTPGLRVFTQFWYRDPLVDAFETGLSDGLTFLLLP